MHFIYLSFFVLQMNTAILMFQKQNTLDCDWLVNGVTALLTSLTHSHFIIAINYNRTVFKRAGECRQANFSA